MRSQGSSPLARGLPAKLKPDHLPCRIIPARAGFTPAGRRLSPPARDHPRSRGVYKLTIGADSLAEGSSPLARGLRVPIHDELGRIGIIPARAGFTLRRRPRTSSRRDHPRSRGVYHQVRGSDEIATGSSPLARGLHIVCVVFEAHCRIIPARAGFTSPLRRPVPRLRDHPRSRGVYRMTRCPASRT